MTAQPLSLETLDIIGPDHYQRGGYPHAEWATDDGRPAPARPSGAAVIGALLGLEMMRRIDPSAIDDRTAVDTLRGAIAAPSHQETH